MNTVRSSETCKPIQNAVGFVWHQASNFDSILIKIRVAYIFLFPPNLHKCISTNLKSKTFSNYQSPGASIFAALTILLRHLLCDILIIHSTSALQVKHTVYSPFTHSLVLIKPSNFIYAVMNWLTICSTNQEVLNSTLRNLPCSKQGSAIITTNLLDYVLKGKRNYISSFPNAIFF